MKLTGNLNKTQGMNSLINRLEYWSYLLVVLIRKADLVSLRVYSLKMSTAGVFTVLFRVILS